MKTVQESSREELLSKIEETPHETAKSNIMAVPVACYARFKNTLI
jgi:hypothetical protein